MTKSSSPVTFTISPNSSPTSPERRAEIIADAGFGRYFSDHMAQVTWTDEKEWHDATLKAYGPISLDPAASVLHYGQEVFEGMKAYKHADGSIWSFRPEANAARINRSGARLAMPEIPQDVFMAAITELVKADAAWVPEGGESSYYLRPFMISSEAFLGVRTASKFEFMVIGGPTSSYFKGGVKPVSIWLSKQYTRAAEGGTGAAKCGGNYAASLLAGQEAAANGCDQVCFLDAAEHKWIEELGGMNLFFVYKDGSIVTPELTGTILEGITRESLITLARDAGHTVTERRISIDEWRDGVRSGEITEVFACGTAAVLTPVGTLVDGEERYESPADGTGPVAAELRKQLTDLQYGRAEDTRGWLTRLA